MKYLSILLVGVMMVGCEQGSKADGAKLPSVPGLETVYSEYKVVVIDSCEYIFAWIGGAYGGGTLTHKGNCKFCREREIYKGMRFYNAPDSVITHGNNSPAVIGKDVNISY